MPDEPKRAVKADSVGAAVGGTPGPSQSGAGADGSTVLGPHREGAGQDVAPTDLADHSWLGDEEGHNCLTCVEHDDSLRTCWPQAHPCALCEKVPCAWPDVMCVPCRAETDAVADEVTDVVEHLLTKHAPFAPLSSTDRTLCRCGALFIGGPGYHRRHVAELIYDALGIDGPSPWVFGKDSPSRGRFANGRIVADA